MPNIKYSVLPVEYQLNVLLHVTNDKLVYEH